MLILQASVLGQFRASVGFGAEDFRFLPLRVSRISGLSFYAVGRWGHRAYSGRFRI